MEIIGAGFGRTGTTSLKVALERLGFGPCEHMFDVTRNPDRVRLWQGIADGKPVDWSQVFCGYRATVDWPGAAYWRELAEAFPLAKVILTVRDPDRWFDSAVQTVFKFPTRCHTRLQRAIFATMNRLNPGSVAVPRMLQAIVVNRVFHGQTLDGGDGDREFATRLFHEHIEAVKASVPSHRLLVFDVSEGWQPLCAFLGVPVPDGPFPRANDLDTFKRRLTGQLSHRGKIGSSQLPPRQRANALHHRPAHRPEQARKLRITSRGRKRISGTARGRRHGRRPDAPRSSQTRWASSTLV